MRGARILLVEDNEINQQVATEMLESENFLVDLAANAMEADRQLCLEAGMNDFVTKPIEPPKLWSTLLKWIQPHAGLGQVSKSGERKPAGDRSALQALADVAGLDARLGLLRASGNADLYLQLLKRFVKSQEHTAAGCWARKPSARSRPRWSRSRWSRHWSCCKKAAPSAPRRARVERAATQVAGAQGPLNTPPCCSSFNAAARLVARSKASARTKRSSPKRWRSAQRHCWNKPMARLSLRSR